MFPWLSLLLLLSSRAVKRGGMGLLSGLHSPMNVGYLLSKRRMVYQPCYGLT